jgi:riboflavin kinase/FMN adenylyltransferase
MTDDARIIQGLANVPAAARGGVLSIGNFDGVHRGHQALLAEARNLAGDSPVVAATFEPPPDLVIRPADAPERITPPDAKAQHLLEGGADFVLFIAPDREFLSLSPDAFIAHITDSMRPIHMVEGTNFFFGKGRKGNVEVLRHFGVSHGFDVLVVDPVDVVLNGERQQISSTVIREMIRDGEVARAAELLGRPFALYGPVEAGRGTGRTLGCPTINVAETGQIVPADGIYAGWADVGGHSAPAAMFVGPAKTFDVSHRTIEAHLLDTTGDFYGLAARLRFGTRLRSIMKFDDVDQLISQIQEDLAHVRQYCQ